MKTIGMFLYRLAVLSMLWLIFVALFMYKEPLNNIAMELKLANEINMCIADPNCTPNSEM